MGTLGLCSGKVTVQSAIMKAIHARRTIHSIPEIAGHEFKTAAFIKHFLQQEGIPFQPVGPTGVTTTIKGSQPGITVGLRCDIDALPMDEHTDLSFRSTHEGMMHACGHDLHTATMLGVATVLNSVRKNLNGSVRIIFQPAEEGGSDTGAKFLIENGVLDNPKVDFILGMHVWPDLNIGTVAIPEGPVMASSDTLRLFVRGVSGHAASPHLTVDAIATAAHVIVALNTFLSRSIDPCESMVISLGTIKGGTRRAIIADSVEIEGTIRTVNPSVRQQVLERIPEICNGVAAAFRGKCEVPIEKGRDAVINDPIVARIVRESARFVPDIKSVLESYKPIMASEDFSEYLKHVPGVFCLVGTTGKGVQPVPLHSPHLAISDEVLELTIPLFAEATLRLLETKDQ